MDRMSFFFFFQMFRDVMGTDFRGQNQNYLEYDGVIYNFTIY